ncbi:hypothetical protein IRA26_004352 [Salmonella enterica]|nr:hypothetical protein [Salmonella enterica]
MPPAPRGQWRLNVAPECGANVIQHNAGDYTQSRRRPSRQNEATPCGPSSYNLHYVLRPRVRPRSPAQRTAHWRSLCCRRRWFIGGHGSPRPCGSRWFAPATLPGESLPEGAVGLRPPLKGVYARPLHRAAAARAAQKAARHSFPPRPLPPPPRPGVVGKGGVVLWQRWKSG